MSESEDPQSTPSSRTRPQRLHDGSDDYNDLAEIEDPLEEEIEHGRIGYGRFGEWTPYALAIAIILTIVIIAAVNWAKDDDSSNDEQTNTEAIARGPAPTFTTTQFNGQPIDLPEFRGKVVVVNFWASWCGPCKEEMPALQALADANPEDVVIIGVAAASDTLDAAQKFATDLGVSYPLILDQGGNGPVGEIAGEYQVFGYPATYFINADGNIVDVVFGATPIEDLQTYVDRAKATTSDQ